MSTNTSNNTDSVYNDGSIPVIGINNRTQSIDDDDDKFEDAINEFPDPQVPPVPVVFRPVQRVVDFTGVLNDEVLDNEDVGDNEVGFTMDEIKDAAVAERTTSSYIGNIYVFLQFCMDATSAPYNSVVTDIGRQNLMALHPRQGERSIAYKRRKFSEMKKILRECSEVPLININILSADDLMNYIRQIRGVRNGRMLSKSSFANHRAALNHLYRCHNRRGFSHSVGENLRTLFKGLYRNLAKRKRGGVVRRGRGTNVVAADDGSATVGTVFTAATGAAAAVDDQNEAKDPLSVEVLKLLLKGFLDWNTTDGVFAYCYLLLTWHLMCRSENTALLSLSNISWSTSFDSFQICFSHSKTDQTGEDSKHPRHLYANPHNPLLCPVTALGIYFSTCFSTEVIADNCYLFPGSNQDNRFSKCLTRLLKAKEHEIRSEGFEISQIGSHSIRKGSSSYLTSLPGGPPAAAIMIRGGWSMGNVKDRYFKYIEAGDQYCGRCLTCSPVLSASLAASPPFFEFENQYEDDYLNQTCALQFGQLYDVFGFGKLLRMCVASLVYHHEWFDSHLYNNHVLFQTSTILRNQTFVNRMSSLVKVTYPWNDMAHSFSGVPPHTSLLQELQTIKVDQRDLITNFVTRVKTALEGFGLDADRISMEQRIKNLLTDFAEKMDNLYGKGGAIDTIAATDEGTTEDTEETGKYRWHDYLGGMHRVPESWEFPRCGVRDLWRQWWIGDRRRQVSPLRFVKLPDVKHLDKRPITEEERHGRRGKFKNKRREARKVLCDINFIIKFIRKKLEEKNLYFKKNEPITQRKVNNMFEAINGEFMVNERDLQKSWLSVVRQLRASGKNDDSSDSDEST